MSPQGLIDLLRRAPFAPFRIYASEGRTYDVRHPDRALVSWSRVILPLSTRDEIPERFEHLALTHIIRVEKLPPVASSA